VDAKDIVTIVVQSLGVAALVFAGLQLREVRARRRADMYWKVYDLYLSEHGRASREAVDKIEEKLGLPPHPAASAAPDDALIERYDREFHEAHGDSDEKALDRKARWRLRFLCQTAILLRRGLLDRDLTYGLLGAGLEIDYFTLKVVVLAHRRGHDVPLYLELEELHDDYQRWLSKRRAAGTRR
jgi:hypothetical protein